MRLRRLGQVSSFCWEIMHLSISPQSNRFIKTVHHFLSLCFGDLFIKWDKNEINLQDSKLSSHVGPKNMPSTVDKKSTPDETSNSHTHTHTVNIILGNSNMQPCSQAFLFITLINGWYIKTMRKFCINHWEKLSCPLLADERI